MIIFGDFDIEKEKVFGTSRSAAQAEITYADMLRLIKSLSNLPWGPPKDMFKINPFIQDHFRPRPEGW